MVVAVSATCLTAAVGMYHAEEGLQATVSISYDRCLGRRAVDFYFLFFYFFGSKYNQKARMVLLYGNQKRFSIKY